MTPTPSPLLAHLRRDTSAQHEAVETNRFNQHLASGTATAADAAWFLGKLYGFVAPLEARLAELASQLDPAWELPARRRAHLILPDLHDLLGPAAAPPPLAAALPPLTTLAEALGVLYVLEGSTLGGQVIARQLAKAGIVGGQRYFTAYGPLTGPRWQTTCRLLAEAATPENEAAIVAAATRTFHDLGQWLEVEAGRPASAQN